MAKKPFWEKAYKDASVSTFGKPSDEFNSLVKKLPQGAKVLDLGAGDGRNAIFLAKKGFDVTAVDVSEAGIKKLEKIAGEKGAKVKTKVQDMREFKFDEQYDLIISHGCLHMIERKEWQKLIERIRENTKLGGYNVILVFTDKIEPSKNLKEFMVGLFREGEIFSLYSDWEIIQQKSYVFNDKHPGGVRHTHSVNKIVAKKI